MTKFDLNSVKDTLSRDEMRMISGGKKENYIGITCKNGTTSASTSNSTMAEAEAYAASLCNGGGYSIICVGDC